jgi:hypothetical protein
MLDDWKSRVMSEKRTCVGVGCEKREEFLGEMGIF